MSELGALHQIQRVSTDFTVPNVLKLLTLK